MRWVVGSTKNGVGGDTTYTTSPPGGLAGLSSDTPRLLVRPYGAPLKQQPPRRFQRTLGATDEANDEAHDHRPGDIQGFPSQ